MHKKEFTLQFGEVELYFEVELFDVEQLEQEMERNPRLQNDVCLANIRRTCQNWQESGIEDLLERSWDLDEKIIELYLDQILPEIPGDFAIKREAEGVGILTVEFSGIDGLFRFSIPRADLKRLKNSLGSARSGRTEINNFLLKYCSSHSKPELSALFKEHWGLRGALYGMIRRAFAPEVLGTVKKSRPGRSGSSKLPKTTKRGEE